MSKETENKNIGLNIWKPNIDIGSYKYILTNKSKTQSYLIGVEGKLLRGLAPLETMELEGKDDLKFEHWTAKLISQGKIEIKIQKSKVENQESNGCKNCGRKISPRNKNNICQYCRKK